MLHHVSLAQQYAKAAGGGLRVLVCGAGVAGMTITGLLRRAGVDAVLIERARDTVPAGYMLALLPMADPAIDDLGARDRYRHAGIPIRRYAVDGHTGRRLREDSIAAVVNPFGDYLGIDRGSLIDVLSGDGAAATTGAWVCGVTDRSTDSGEEVAVSIVSDDGVATLAFDVVVIAEGMGSRTRELLGHTVDRLDTGWGGWVVWTEPDGDHDLGEELWGAGSFVATYPVADRLGVFLGGVAEDTKAGPREFVESMRHRICSPTPRIGRAMSAVVAAEDPYFWALADIRARDWVRGRTVLLGDAAAGFLPTAGIGAGMAMESAWVLARLLRDARRTDLPAVLSRYERTQRPRVIAAQQNSRRLARLMFRRSRLLAVVREAALRGVGVDRALGPIRRLLQTPPEVRGT
ncbi:FAD-dependent oxidoreductase [Mycobacterium sp. smrl_JER01]|uniref:FAD-dependent oxidoreductase n=1 Tax=Mycobacterium sp. smrl_JER01 TaxID=3402633 RepID=UPI003AD65A0F